MITRKFKSADRNGKPIIAEVAIEFINDRGGRLLELVRWEYQDTGNPVHSSAVDELEFWEQIETSIDINQTSLGAL